jgi:hypothetical protein
MDRLDRLRQPIPSALPHQRPRLHERSDGLLQEERVPALDEKLLECSKPGILAEERSNNSSALSAGRVSSRIWL